MKLRSKQTRKEKRPNSVAAISKYEVISNFFTCDHSPTSIPGLFFSKKLLKSGRSIMRKEESGRKISQIHLSGGNFVGEMFCHGKFMFSKIFVTSSNFLITFLIKIQSPAERLNDNGRFALALCLSQQIRH